jgi:hypothetical protein
MIFICEKNDIHPYEVIHLCKWIENNDIHPCKWIKITLNFKFQTQSFKLKLQAHAQAIL